GEKVLAQVRPGVAAHTRDAARALARDQQRAAAAAVLRIARIARAPAGAGTRHAAGRPAAEDRECQAHAATAAARGTFANNLKKFSVVWRAISSNETTRTSASILASWSMHDASLRLSRYGVRARTCAS